MANSLEKFFLAKVKMMPPVEVDLTQQMMTKKNDPPKKVLPPGSSHNALTNSTNKISLLKIPCLCQLVKSFYPWTRFSNHFALVFEESTFFFISTPPALQGGDLND